MDRIYLFNINSKKMNSSLLIGICKCLKIAQINKCQLYNTKLGFIYQTYLLKRAIEYISYFVNCPCGQKKHKVCNRVILVAVQTGTGKIDPARKIKSNRGVGQAGYCNISVRARNGSGWYMPPVTNASTRGRDGSNSN